MYLKVDLLLISFINSALKYCCLLHCVFRFESVGVHDPFYSAHLDTPFQLSEGCLC